MPSYNIVQTIYTMDSFAVLRDKVSAYFTNRGFLLGDDPEDKLTDCPLIQRWVKGDCVGPARCYAIVYASRLHYNEIGGGTLVVVNNNRSSNSESPIPDTAAKFFDGLPNSVSLDAHQYWSRESNGLAAELAMFLSKRGHHSIMLSFDDRVTAIKSNPYLSIDERLVELAATVEGYLPVPAAFPVLEAELRQQAGDCIWNELSPNARNYLRTGCIGFDQLDGASRVVLEASPGVISLSKALEDTVIRRLRTRKEITCTCSV